MANRHLARSVVLQTLFEWDFGGKKTDAVDESLERNANEFASGMQDLSFMKDLFALVLKKQEVIDEIIENAAPDWPLDKIAIVDRNVLRLGLAELLFSNRDEVPPKVAINEAIELAKTFGGEKSGKFVNGVLGAVYKEMGEPGKDQSSGKKKKEEVDLSKLPIEKKAGGVVYAEDEDGIHFAFVHDVFGYWTLAKGGINDGETLEEGAARHIKDELGLDVKVIKLLGENEYVANHPEKGKIRKQVSYFLTKSDYVPVELTKKSGGLDDAKWFSSDELEDIKSYDDILPLLVQSIEHITK